MELEQDGERNVGVIGGVAHLRDAELGGGPVAAAHGRRLVHPVAEHLRRELLERRPVAAGGGRREWHELDAAVRLDAERLAQQREVGADADANEEDGRVAQNCEERRRC